MRNFRLIASFLLFSNFLITNGTGHQKVGDIAGSSEHTHGHQQLGTQEIEEVPHAVADSELELDLSLASPTSRRAHQRQANVPDRNEAEKQQKDKGKAVVIEEDEPENDSLGLDDSSMRIESAEEDAPAFDPSSGTILPVQGHARNLPETGEHHKDKGKEVAKIIKYKYLPKSNMLLNIGLEHSNQVHQGQSSQAVQMPIRKNVTEEEQRIVLDLVSRIIRDFNKHRQQKGLEQLFLAVPEQKQQSGPSTADFNQHEQQQVQLYQQYLQMFEQLQNLRRIREQARMGAHKLLEGEQFDQLKQHREQEIQHYEQQLRKLKQWEGEQKQKEAHQQSAQGQTEQIRVGETSKTVRPQSHGHSQEVHVQNLPSTSSGTTIILPPIDQAVPQTPAVSMQRQSSVGPPRTPIGSSMTHQPPHGQAIQQLTIVSNERQLSLGLPGKQTGFPLVQPAHARAVKAPPQGHLQTMQANQPPQQQEQQAPGGNPDPGPSITFLRQSTVQEQQAAFQQALQKAAHQQIQSQDYARFSQHFPHLSSENRPNLALPAGQNSAQVGSSNAPEGGPDEASRRDGQRRRRQREEDEVGIRRREQHQKEHTEREHRQPHERKNGDDGKRKRRRE